MKLSILINPGESNKDCLQRASEFIVQAHRSHHSFVCIFFYGSSVSELQELDSDSIKTWQKISKFYELNYCSSIAEELETEMPERVTSVFHPKGMSKWVDSLLVADRHLEFV